MDHQGSSGEPPGCASEDSIQRFSNGPRLSILSAPADPSQTVVDIVFVHGLIGSPQCTWTQDRQPINQIGALLSHLSDEFPRSRIFSFGCERSDLLWLGSPHKSRTAAHTLLEELGNSRCLPESVSDCALFDVRLDHLRGRVSRTAWTYEIVDWSRSRLLTLCRESAKCSHLERPTDIIPCTQHGWLGGQAGFDLCLIRDPCFLEVHSRSHQRCGLLRNAQL